MSDLTYEALLREHPEISGFKVRFSGSGDEGIVDYVDTIDQSGNNLDLDTYQAEEFAVALLDKSIDINNLSGYENNEGGVIEASFKVIRNDEEITVLLDSDNVQYYEEVEKDTDFEVGVEVLNDGVLKDSRFQLTEDEVSKLKAFGEPIKFRLAFSGSGDSGSLDECECISSEVSGNSTLQAVANRIVSGLENMENDIIREVAGGYENDHGGRGELFFTLNTDGTLTWNDSASELYYYDEVLESSGETMVGMEFSIKGSEIIPINEPEDALSSTVKRDLGLTQ